MPWYWPFGRKKPANTLPEGPAKPPGGAPRAGARRFRAMRNFESTNALGGTSFYVEGLSYSIRLGNESLAARADEWAAKGWIRFMKPTAEAVIVGKG